jgi:hypothetical protein
VGQDMARREAVALAEELEPTPPDPTPGRVLPPFCLALGPTVSYRLDWEKG